MADIKRVLKVIAPWLTTALSFVPGGGVVPQLAAAALTKVTGTEVKPENIETTIADLATSEEGRLKLRQADQEHEKQMTELGYKQTTEVMALLTADTANAREREKAVKDWTPKVLALSVIAVTFFLEGWCLIHGIPATVDKVIAGRILGTLDASSVLVLGYYFGSSVMQARSTELLAKAQPIPDSGQ